MDYGLIFLIIIVIIIIIAIILIIVANRNNVTNILASLPSYRILYTETPSNVDNNYLGLKNSTDFTPNETSIPIERVDFWKAYVCNGVDKSYSLGIWKIENLAANKNPIVSGEEVRIINYYYNVETNNIYGYLQIYSFLINNNWVFTTRGTFTNSNTFIYTVVGTNLFTLKLKLSGKELPVIIDKTNNFFAASTNVNMSPTIFRLVLQ